MWEIFNKQCEVIGVEPLGTRLLTKIDNNWFTRYSWNLEQREEFTDWFIKRFSNTFTNKSTVIDQLDSWIFAYGWTNEGGI